MDGSLIVRVPPRYTLHKYHLESRVRLTPPCSIHRLTAFRLYLEGCVKTGLGKPCSFLNLQTAVFFLPSNSNTSFSSIKSVEVIDTSFKITVKNTCPTPAASPFSTNITAVNFFTKLFFDVQPWLPIFWLRP